MPMEKVGRKRALSKSEFHQRLRIWFDTTDDKIVGPQDIKYHGTEWIYVCDGSELFKLNADTPRSAVGSYLQMVDLHGDDLQWEITKSQQGKMTALAYGPEKLRCKSFNFYFVASPQG